MASLLHITGTELRKDIGRKENGLCQRLWYGVFSLIRLQWLSWGGGNIPHLAPQWKVRLPSGHKSAPANGVCHSVMRWSSFVGVCAGSEGSLTFPISIKFQLVGALLSYNQVQWLIALPNERPSMLKGNHLLIDIVFRLSKCSPPRWQMSSWEKLKWPIWMSHIELIGAERISLSSFCRLDDGCTVSVLSFLCSFFQSCSIYKPLRIRHFL